MTALHMCSNDNLTRNLSGKTYLITGTLSGHMEALAGQLAQQGAAVVLASQDIEETRALAEQISLSTGKDAVRGEQLDMASLDSVRRFAAKFKQDHAWLDGLVNTGDIDKTANVDTQDGHHWQTAVNFLGPFLLTELLLPLLKVSAPARVVHTACVFHERGKLDLHDLDYKVRKHHHRDGWCQSKLAILMYARTQARMLEGTGVSCFGVHIGCTQTKHNPAPHVRVYRKLLRFTSGSDGLISSRQSIQTTLHCLLDEGCAEHSGAYFSQGSRFYKSKAHRNGGWPITSPHADLQDNDLGMSLYEKAAELVNLKESLNKVA